MDNQSQGNEQRGFRGDMAGNQGPGFETVREEAPSLGVLAEIHARLAKLENSHRDINSKVDAATKSGDLDPGLMAKVAHVMTKYFPHDDPETEVVEPAGPMFDAFTGLPLNRVPKFDPMTGERLQ